MGPAGLGAYGVAAGRGGRLAVLSAPANVRRVAARLLYLPPGRADNADMGAFITVSDAAGRVLLRRPATDAEVMSAIAAAQTAEAEGRAAMERIERERNAPADDGDDA